MLSKNQEVKVLLVSIRTVLLVPLDKDGLCDILTIEMELEGCIKYS